MESDDDYQSFWPPKEPSPPPHFRRLKRLKKSHSETTKESSPELTGDPLLFSHVDFAKLEALENDSETQYFNESNSTEEMNLSQESLSQGTGNEIENDARMEWGSDLEASNAKRVLEFDADAMGGIGENGKAIGEYSEGFEPEKSDKGKIGQEGLFEEKEDKKKRKKKREKSDGGDELKTNMRVCNKRTEEKERKAYLEELHAESQRLLRETRDASFKPIPVVQKPISSVLEKIRKRKLEISKKSMIVNDSNHGCEGNIRPRDRLMDLDVSNEQRSEENVAKIVDKEMAPPSLDGQSSLAFSDVDKDDGQLTIHENDQNQVSANEEPTPAFRASAHDTQDLFDDSEPNGATAGQNDEQRNSPLEEDFAPSLLAMNLKFDSAPLDDSSSEEDNDKENVAPHPCGIADGSSSPKGDPVKDFIDDEAEEEDDSDNDLNCFQENEAADDIDDFEELNDMIATEYEERPMDKERRNELHQKWLEQQDAAGTDNLVQRLKCGSGLRDAFLSDNEPETDEDDEKLADEAEEDSLPQKPGRVNIRKAKQIILQLFSGKEDTYLSDDDDDCSTQRRRAQCLIRKEEQAALVSPADDASSREVFGLIKKLNIASENKKKPKSLSIFDSVLKGGNSDQSSKSSFLGRVSNHSLPPSHKQGSATVRSFIFGREDSNSRSSMSMSEDSSDTVSRETRTTRNLTAKYSNSQTKVKSQTRDAAVETLSRTSLLEILKRSSSQSQVCNQDTAVDLTKSMFAFRVPKKPTKIEGRS